MDAEEIDAMLVEARRAARKEEMDRIEALFDTEPTHCTFVKRQSVEECYIIRVKDWQALKGEQ